MSFGGCFWALGFCVDWRGKTCFGKTATTTKGKIGPLWSKIKKLGKNMFLWTKKSFRKKICVHGIKVAGQKRPKYTVWSFCWFNYFLYLPQLHPSQYWGILQDPGFDENHRTPWHGREAPPLSLAFWIFPGTWDGAPSDLKGNQFTELWLLYSNYNI